VLVPEPSGRAERTPSFQTITEVGSHLTLRDPRSRFAREASVSSKSAAIHANRRFSSL
jgi:hypothetical protein